MGYDGIGSFQQQVLEVLEKSKKCTVHEIAEAIHGEKVHYSNFRYVQVHRALQSLEARGIAKKIKVQVKWKLVEKT